MNLRKICSIFNNDINKKNKDGETRLFIAVSQGNVREVERLLARNANPNIPDKHGLTPLHIAAWWGEEKIVRLLLEAKANPNADTGKGWTVLHSASFPGKSMVHDKIKAHLRAHGAVDGVRDRNGMTASDYDRLWDKDPEVAQKLNELVNQQTQRFENGVCPKCGGKHKPCGPSAPNHGQIAA